MIKRQAEYIKLKEKHLKEAKKSALSFYEEHGILGADMSMPVIDDDGVLRHLNYTWDEVLPKKTIMKLRKG